MAKPGFWRNVGGTLVNTFLSPGTTPYGPNGQYNKTLLRNGFINAAVGAAGGPLAGQLSQMATSHWGGGAGQEAGQRGWSWLADQSISPDGLQPMQPQYAVNGVNVPGQIQQEQPQAQQAPAPAQGPPSQLAQIAVNGIPRDGRSGMSAGSSVLAQGKDAQDMVDGMRLSQWLGMRSPYKFRGEA